MLKQRRSSSLAAIFAISIPSCTNVSRRVMISAWSGNIPKQVILYRYKKNSNFSALLQKTDSSLDRVPVPWGADDGKEHASKTHECSCIAESPTDNPKSSTGR